VVQRYWSKLSGPLLDRIDLQIEVPRIKREELTGLPNGETSAEIKQRIKLAREIQRLRFQGTEVFCNARMSSRQLKENSRLSVEAEGFLKSAILHLHLSARGYDRILKIARTIADLAGQTMIEANHIAEAVQYRSLERQPSVGSG